MMIRNLLILATVIGFSTSAFAQTAAPKGGKPVKQAKPSAPMGCKLVGTVKGTKLWAGDCAARARTSGRHTHSRDRRAVAATSASRGT